VLPRLVHSERPAFALMRGALDNPGYIPAHDALAHSLPERAAQHRPHDPDTVGRDHDVAITVTSMNGGQ